MQKVNLRFVNSCALHILAMTIMFIDHLWGTLVPGHMWMTNLGRMAFPIFAFLLVEGFYHTHNLKKYFLRLFAGALLSEIPFNLMMAGGWFDPFEQNVMWTFLIALGCMALTEKLRRRNKYAAIPIGVLIFGAGILLGFVTFVDYYGYGIAMVAAFYVLRGNKWWNMILQLAAMYFINGIWFKGMIVDVTLPGHTFEVVQQSLACFALIPIWLYNGEKGAGGKAFQWFCYLFYPVHILILSLMALYL